MDLVALHHKKLKDLGFCIIRILSQHPILKRTQTIYLKVSYISIIQRKDNRCWLIQTPAGLVIPVINIQCSNTHNLNEEIPCFYGTQQIMFITSNNWSNSKSDKMWINIILPPGSHMPNLKCSNILHTFLISPYMLHILPISSGLI